MCRIGTGENETMNPSQGKPTKSSSDVLLKTTTWGALIAFVLVLTLLGFTGYVDRFTGNVAVPKSKAGNAPVQSAVTPETAKPASSGRFNRSTPGHATESNPFPVSRKEVATASSGN
jgi:hypothetical protein